MQLPSFIWWLALLVGCGAEKISSQDRWSVEVLLPDAVIKSTVRESRFLARAGKMHVSIRKGLSIKCEHQYDFMRQASSGAPRLSGCGISRDDTGSYLISVVLKEKSKPRHLAHARVRFRPQDYPKEDRVVLKLVLDVPVKELDQL
jgi:hypothetical protein